MVVVVAAECLIESLLIEAERKAKEKAHQSTFIVSLHGSSVFSAEKKRRKVAASDDDAVRLHYIPAKSGDDASLIS